MTTTETLNKMIAQTEKELADVRTVLEAETNEIGIHVLICDQDRLIHKLAVLENMES